MRFSITFQWVLAYFICGPYKHFIFLKTKKEFIIPTYTLVYTNSQLLRCSTAKGSSTKLSLVGPTKVKACKSFLFEGFRKLSTDHGLDRLNIILLSCNSQSPILNKFPVHLIIRE